jgi:hypothetical protein
MIGIATQIRLECATGEGTVTTASHINVWPLASDFFAAFNPGYDQ